MTDLAVLAAGFGVIPLAAIILYTVTTLVLAYREAAWGFLAGVLGFLGVSHAMAVVLVNHSLLGDLVCRLLPETRKLESRRLRRAAKVYRFDPVIANFSSRR